MQFRTKLDKKLFKNKKIPPKIRTNEDNISDDQKGDHTTADPGLLSLDKETITQKVEEKLFPTEDVSRRGLFSTLGSLKKFAEEAEEKELQKKKIRKKKKKKTGESKLETQEAAAAGQESEETSAEAPPPPALEEPPKKGFFKRIIDRFRPSAKMGEDAAEPEGGDSAGEVAAKVPSAPKSASLPEPDIDEEEEEERPEEDVEMDRRNLLRQGVHFFAKPAVDSVQKKIDKVNETVNKITKRVPLLRPPGAISERAFLNACTRCDDCVNACPKDAIKKAPKKMGFLIMGTPYIDPMKNPCVMCEDLPCIPACQDEALLPVARPADVQMGYVILDKKKCQAYGITFCQQCIIDCPIPGAITQVNEQPVFHKNICTGCGVCVRSCSTVNIPVALKIKPQMVIEYQIQQREMEKRMALKEAELKAAREAEEKAALEDSSGEPADISADSN